MRIRATSAFLRFCPAVAGIALSCLAADTTFAQRGQPIEFSSPQSGVVASNLNQLGTKKPGLKRLEEDLSRQIESLNPDSSLGPVIDAPSHPPPPRSIIQSKREKELEDLRKNWVFANPDEVTQGPTPEKIFGLKEYEKSGEEKKPMSALEKFFQNSDRKRGGPDGQVDKLFADQENDGFRSLRSTDRWGSLDEGINKSGPSLKGFFGPSLDGRTAPHPPTTPNGLSISDLVKVGGLQNGRVTPEQARMDARMDEYKQLLGPSSIIPSASGSLDPLNSKTESTGSSLNPSKNLELFTSPTKQDPLNPFQNAINPAAAFQPPTLPDANRAFGQPGQAPPLSPTPPAKAQPPPTPFTFPTRKF